VERQQLIITIPELTDLSMEQLAIQQNSGLFQDTFGMKILLRGTQKEQKFWR
jgi:exopolyphosphatase/guanosine-5'-triphosphate,3'-diphosphate pyrophosphatase